MMVEKGTKFTFNGKLAKALEYMPFVGLWFCVYEEDEGYFYLFPEEIEKSRKESDKNKMKLEYKFYEKNLAPKWLEGDYDLHIEGNRMVMTSKDGKKVEARCHPEDDWRLQVGIDELKERMAEAKKPREIKVGDKVVVRMDGTLNPYQLANFFENADVKNSDVVNTMMTMMNNRRIKLFGTYEVAHIGAYVNKAFGGYSKAVLLKARDCDDEFVVDVRNLRLVEE